MNGLYTNQTSCCISLGTGRKSGYHLLAGDTRHGWIGKMTL